MKIVEFKNVKKIYKVGEQEFKALDDVSLEIETGKLVVILGPSGAGKSTLLNMLGALDIPDSGEITVAGNDLTVSKKLNEFRAEKIGFIFQLHNLIPNLSVRQNIEIPMYTQGLSSSQMSQKALSLLDEVGLRDKADLKPTKLSGGERQRVAIARALANDPSIILADEPTGALDSKTGHEVMDLLEELNKEGQTIILITHDINIAQRAKRILKMMDGNLEEV